MPILIRHPDNMRIPTIPATFPTDGQKVAAFPSESVAGFARNGGRFPSEYPAGIPRNTQIIKSLCRERLKSLHLGQK